MQYTLLGDTGLRVSECSLGTMTFGDDWGWGAERETCEELFETYADAGGNFIDTANVYTNGSSERILGDLLDGRRDDFVLASKYTLSTNPRDPNASGNHRKNMFRAVDASLDRLNTDYLDLLWVHAYDGLTPLSETMRALDDLVRQGKVHYVGLSDFPAWAASRAVTLAEERDWTRPAALQFEYNLVERTVERELLPMADALDLGVTAWGPLKAGVLTGKYLDDAGEGRRTQTGQGVTERENDIAREVVAVAEELEASPAQVALAWVRQQGDVIPIVGATKPAHLEDNLASLTLALDDDHLERLDEVSAVDMGFPRDFLTQPRIREVLYGETDERLDVDTRSNLF
ncbi:aldo/keto reductase [Haloarchaeobius sp. DFWS5]|uniref:aldo/keto reductase n=1 Tax=Haloarchaeobius sp. DFWS5 TaxID=3446114 RepID=UPI003EBDBFC2